MQYFLAGAQRSDAEFGKTYRHQDHNSKFVPYGAVVAGKKGLMWKPACTQVDPKTGERWTCGQIAQQAQNGSPTGSFCIVERHKQSQTLEIDYV